MTAELIKNLALVKRQPDILKNARRGIEREGLRVTQDSNIATTKHPEALGSALTHSSITTDYSEALLEFITTPTLSVADTIKELTDIHAYTARILHQQNEYLWPASMPCILGDDESIPVAEFGTSNSAQMKHAYRLGLGHRYGRKMQTIAGIHYNFSLPDELWQLIHDDSNSTLSLKDFKTERYFGLIRNFRRYFWLMLYLFGASPAVSKEFADGLDHGLEKQFKNTLSNAISTSLRMGDIGYQSNAQSSLVVCYNDLSSYVRTLVGALNKPYSQYESIPVQTEEGYQQLSTSLLQIENEFYSTIRPKRTQSRGETALHALLDRGVEYIEVRCVDIDPFNPNGISAERCRVIEAFLLWCALKDSPDTFEEEYKGIADNQSKVVNHGLDSDLMLYHRDGPRNIRVWGLELMQEIIQAADLFDTGSNDNLYKMAIRKEIEKFRDASLTPSARIMSALDREQLSFTEYMQSLAAAHQQYWLNYPLHKCSAQKFNDEAKASILKQQQLEQQDTIDFDQYLSDYLAQYQDKALNV